MKRGLVRVGLILCAALAHALSFGASGVQAQSGLEDIGFVLGDTAAPVKVIEFGDFGQIRQNVYIAMNTERSSSPSIGQGLADRNGRSEKNCVKIVVQRLRFIQGC